MNCSCGNETKGEPSESYRDDCKSDNATMDVSKVLGQSIEHAKAGKQAEFAFNYALAAKEYKVAAQLLQRLIYSKQVTDEQQLALLSSKCDKFIQQQRIYEKKSAEGSKMAKKTLKNEHMRKFKMEKWKAKQKSDVFGRLKQQNAGKLRIQRSLLSLEKQLDSMISGNEEERLELALALPAVSNDEPKSKTTEVNTSRIAVLAGFESISEFDDYQTASETALLPIADIIQEDEKDTKEEQEVDLLSGDIPNYTDMYRRAVCLINRIDKLFPTLSAKKQFLNQCRDGNKQAVMMQKILQEASKLRRFLKARCHNDLSQRQDEALFDEFDEFDQDEQLL